MYLVSRKQFQHVYFVKVFPKKIKFQEEISCIWTKMLTASIFYEMNKSGNMHIENICIPQAYIITHGDSKMIIIPDPRKCYVIKNHSTLLYSWYPNVVFLLSLQYTSYVFLNRVIRTFNGITWLTWTIEQPMEKRNIFFKSKDLNYITKSILLETNRLKHKLTTTS